MTAHEINIKFGFKENDIEEILRVISNYKAMLFIRRVEKEKSNVKL